MARAIVPGLIENGRVSRGWLGVWLSNVTERRAKREGLDAVRGVVIDSVFAGSPAQQAGVRRGDIVVSFDNKDVVNSNQFSVLVSTVRAGMEVPLELIRDGERMRAFATVVDRDSFLEQASGRRQDDGTALSWLGMELVTFTPRMAGDIGINHVQGVYVAQVYAGSSADRASISEGTIIMQVNNEPISSTDDVRMIAVQMQGSSDRIPLIVQEPDGTIARKVVRR
jgi:serine protease Do